MNENQYKMLHESMPSLVGGIAYNSVRKKQEEESEKDIYGNAIDLSNLLSYWHWPVATETPVQSGYQKQYTFPTEETVSPDEETSVETQVVAVPTISGMQLYTGITTPEQKLNPNPDSEVEEIYMDVLTGKEGFKKLEKLYEVALKKRGLDPTYARWLAAQDALESGWGKSQGARRHNYGNLTTGVWKGDSFVGDDHDARGKRIKQTFRAYSSVNEYVEDKLNFLTGLKRYKDVFVGDPSLVIDRMFTAGYAVDPEYANKVKRVYNNW